MYDNEKIYSIELGEDLALPHPPRKQGAVKPTSRPAARPARPVRQDAKAPSRKASKPPRGELQFAPLLVLTYLLGPLSVPLDQENRKRKGLLYAGLISGMACLGLLAGHAFLLDLMGRAWPLWSWLLGGALVLVTAFTVWARNAYLIVERQRLPRHLLPAIMRRPWAVGAVGLLAPGLGLLMAGCPRRGAAVIWMGWTIITAAVILAGGAGLWEGNQAVQQGAMDPVVLETVFLAAAGVLALGLVIWVAQALEGARKMMEEPGIRHRMRGDWYAAALMVSLIGMAVVWDPAAMAEHLDGGSVILRENGFRLIPLKLSQAAHRLDPAPAHYAIRAMELCEELGRKREAARLRRELDGNLASYLALVRSEEPKTAAAGIAGRGDYREWTAGTEWWEQAGPHGGDRPRYQAR